MKGGRVGDKQASRTRKFQDELRAVVRVGKFPTVKAAVAFCSGLVSRQRSKADINQLESVLKTHLKPEGSNGDAVFVPDMRAIRASFAAAGLTLNTGDGEPTHGTRSETDALPPDTGDDSALVASATELVRVFGECWLTPEEARAILNLMTDEEAGTFPEILPGSRPKDMPNPLWLLLISQELLVSDGGSVLPDNVSFERVHFHVGEERGPGGVRWRKVPDDVTQQQPKNAWLKTLCEGASPKAATDAEEPTSPASPPPAQAPALPPSVQEEPTPAAAPAQADPIPAAPAAEAGHPDATLLHVCDVVEAEARALVLLLKDEVLPSPLPRNARRDLGSALWSVLKNQGLVSTEGVGHGTVATPNVALFAHMRFRIVEERAAKSSRWKDMPRTMQDPREQGAWWKELVLELKRRREAVGRVEPPAPDPSEEIERDPEPPEDATEPVAPDGEVVEEGEDKITQAVHTLEREIANREVTIRSLEIERDALQTKIDHERAAIAQFHTTITQLRTTKNLLDQ